MTTFLNLNGIEVPCSVSAGAKGSTEEVGASKRAVDGTMLIHRRITKQHWLMQLTPQDDQHARAFRDLILGKGHYWSFDANVYSSKGLGPSAAVGSVQSAGSAYIGAGKLAQTAGGTNNIQFTLSDIVTKKQWTVIYVRNVGGAGFVRYLSTFDGGSRVDYTNGVVGSAQGWLTVTAATGLVTLTSDSSSAVVVDELVVLPFNVPVDWVAQIDALYNSLTAWSALARLNATGNAIEGNKVTVPVMGTAKDMTWTPSTLAGASFAENNATFSFELQEV